MATKIAHKMTKAHENGPLALLAANSHIHTKMCRTIFLPLHFARKLPQSSTEQRLKAQTIQTKEERRNGSQCIHCLMKWGLNVSTRTKNATRNSMHCLPFGIHNAACLVVFIRPLEAQARSEYEKLAYVKWVAIDKAKRKWKKRQQQQKARYACRKTSDENAKAKNPLTHTHAHISAGCLCRAMPIDCARMICTQMAW